MRRLAIVLTLSALVAVLLPASVGASHGPTNYRAHLTGDEEVPARDTDATGQATFQLSDDGEALTYRLVVANIRDVGAAHIHLAPAGENGPVVAWLFAAGDDEGGRRDGVLAEGTITADDLVGPLTDEPLSALVEALEEGGAYVNVHTAEFPGGEIRGQVAGGGHRG